MKRYYIAKKVNVLRHGVQYVYMVDKRGSATLLLYIQLWLVFLHCMCLHLLNLRTR